MLFLPVCLSSCYVPPRDRTGPPPATRTDLSVYSSSKSLESVESKSSSTATTYSTSFIRSRSKSRAAPSDDDATPPASYDDSPPVIKVRTSPPTPERNIRYTRVHICAIYLPGGNTLFKFRIVFFAALIANFPPSVRTWSTYVWYVSFTVCYRTDEFKQRRITINSRSRF